MNKFRAWDKEKKIMDMVDGITFDGDEIWEISFPGDCWRDASNYILMQSTGLTDKNGKEIFEGDVIECFTEGLSVVEFKSGVFGLNCNDHFEGFNNVLGQCKVIGNVHEHPYLFEK